MASAVGTYGTVEIKAEHRVQILSPDFDESAFVTISDYNKPELPLYPRFAPYAPRGWPVYYDERAHKPHHLDRPASWDLPAVSDKEFSMKFGWNWCEDKLQAKVYVGRDSLPTPGPNRPGRTDSGNQSIEIIYTD